MARFEAELRLVDDGHRHLLVGALVEKDVTYASVVRDDGTVCPSAAVASLPFAPEVVAPLALALRLERRSSPYSQIRFARSSCSSLLTRCHAVVGIPGSRRISSGPAS